MERYICNIDGMEFTDKNDLISHLFREYVDIVAAETIDGLSVEDVYRAFKERLPNDVKVRVNTDKDSGVFNVNLKSNICNFEFAVGGECGEPYCPYEGCFRFLSDAVDYYSEYFEIANQIIEEVKKEYELDLEVVEMWEDALGIGRSISFRFIVDDMMCVTDYDFSGVDDFLYRFQQYTSNVLEGRLEIERVSQYKTEYRIDGVPLKGFAIRSNKVRLEIIE